MKWKVGAVVYSSCQHKFRIQGFDVDSSVSVESVYSCTISSKLNGLVETQNCAFRSVMRMLYVTVVQDSE
jgi:hypothetical protein